LVIDGGSRGDIGVIRSLGFGDVPVHLLVSDPTSPSVASRYVTSVHPFPGLRATDEKCLDAIHAAATAIGTRPVMLATGDRALALMSRRREQLTEWVDIDLAPDSVINTCLDKSCFAPVARRLNLPVPQTYVPTTLDDARVLVKELSYPVFVKPIDRADWERLPAGTVNSAKGQRYDSAAPLLALFETLDSYGAIKCVIQNFVEGGDGEHMSVHAYVLPDGTIAGTFTGSKVRIYPPGAGVGALVVSKRMPHPEQLARDVLKALGYTGFAILQFKRDVHRNRYELLEINCRYSTWTELPSRAGCNFPLVAYAAMTGAPLPPIVQREGIAWLDFQRDREGMSTYRQSGEWTWWSYLKSLRPVRSWAYFSWRDPGPFLRQVRNR